ncbi:hypothetical protein B5K05_13295 [Rhizobium phaseoli]|uniref:DNA/RNA non-specific endonuclease n=1 Tax=Rhizobium phaseoli TaxID=396 RepID=UPI000E0DCF46|nr:DNA/RNA non-specific endonuclease [Rhizobium phaseoli]RDJ10105.1 hypothetical protein B5K04_13270 [Rhizobium phaseoli]RDJ14105.1 hypothetical protein B5K05_13295 [Rhizobium phaseoli]
MASSHTEKLKNFLTRIQSGPSANEAVGGFESALSPLEDAEAIAARSALPDSRRGLVKSALEKLGTNQELSREEGFVTEAIIIPDKRPAIDIVGGDFQVDHPLWTQFSSDPLLHGNIKKALPSVGRIELSNHPTSPYGGTGFVVGKDLLMTNRHVAEIFSVGLGYNQIKFKNGLSAGIDFERERSSEIYTIIAVRKVVMIHPYWDMALLQVDGLAAEHAPLLLSVQDPDELINTPIAVIGYPAFDARNDARVQNEVFRGLYNIKRLQPGLIMPRTLIASFGKMVSALCHDSSTLGGNSGSEVYDPKSGKVLALHFAGVYLDRNYCVPTGELARDGRVVDAGVNFEPGASGGTPTWQAWWRNTDEERAIQEPTRPPSPPAASSLAPGQGMSWTVPIEILIRIGEQPLVSLASPPTPPEALPATEAMVSPNHDPNYSTRRGYNTKFLPIAVPAPEPRNLDMVVCLGGRPLIPYHHFSLALHKARRIALFTASNLDAAAAARTPEAERTYDRKTLGGLGKADMEKWFPDPRIDPAFQLPDRFYNKDKGAFDKGHIVRRDDVAWGKSFEEAQFANGDTFHITNCSPQVSGFNQSAQGVDNWGDLENYVMKQAAADKLSIFAGPVLAKDDPIFVGVDDLGPVRLQIPRQYWKIILVADGGMLKSFAFVLRQDLSDTPLDATWQKYMISIADLAALNPLVKLDKSIEQADQSGRDSGVTIRELVAIELIAKKASSRKAAITQ